jgi:hypothetical protein
LANRVGKPTGIGYDVDDRFSKGPSLRL